MELLGEPGRGLTPERAGAEAGESQSRLFGGQQSLAALLQVATRGHHVMA